jgi:hypothetical protein
VRGLDVDLRDTDVEAIPSSLDASGALRVLGFDPP